MDNFGGANTHAGRRWNAYIRGSRLLTFGPDESATGAVTWKSATSACLLVRGSNF